MAATPAHILEQAREFILAGHSHKAAHAQLLALGYEVSLRTLKRHLPAAEVRAAGAAEGTPEQLDPGRRLARGFRNLEVDGRVVEAQAPGASAEERQQVQAAAHFEAPGFRRVYLENIGLVIERLIPTEAPLDADGNEILPLVELAMLCAAVLRTGKPPQLVALSCGLDPVHIDRIITDGVADFGLAERTGPAIIALAVLGHREACDSRLAETVVSAANRGRWEAMRMAREITAAQPIDIAGKSNQLTGPVVDIVAALHRARGQDRRRLALVQAQREREEQRLEVSAR